MAHIAGFGRDQLLLLPEAIDDYVEADNSVRFIDVFVGGLQELRTKLFAHSHAGHPLTIAQNTFASLNRFIAQSLIEKFGGHGRIQF
jgi:hypothetical protein